MEVAERVPPVLHGGAFINAQADHPVLLLSNSVAFQVAAQQAQQTGHCAEQQHAVPAGLQLDQHAVQHSELAALGHQLESVDWPRCDSRVDQDRLIVQL